MQISDKELVHLVRLALEGKTDDVAVLARRIARKIQATSPDSATALLRIAKSHGKAEATRGKTVAQLPVDLESRLELAKVENSIGVPSLILAEGVGAVLRQVVSERENEEALAQADLHPAKSLLFHGPPGVGKTLSARWLAAQLHVPLITLDLSAVMSSFLGRTGNNLRNVLDYAKGVGCVLLLDEFDAIAKRRDDAIEVGELKRLVTVLLQEIDHWPSSGILIAATNHPELLDPAVWRRFDLVVEFGLPADEQVEEVVGKLLGGQHQQLAAAVAIAMRGMSFSDIEREILRAKRASVLAKTKLEDSLEMLIKERVSGQKKKDQIAAAVAISKTLGQRRAHDITGVSRDTIRKEAIAGEPEDD